ncbi:MAG TPA: outer membrane protein transport protein [Candidatus Udaeobacter sp.]
MKSLIKKLAIASALATASTAFATNGDDLIAIGATARALGGTGIATPQDAISAVFANPAAMCFTPGCAYAEVNFDGTLFMPHISAEVDNPAGSFSSDSHSAVYGIPAIGLSLPLDSVTRRWRFGLAAYGVTGLGVDYRSTVLDQPKFFDFGPFGKFPLVAGEYTSLQIMKFAPAIAYQVTPQLSLGFALHVDYALLDLGHGSSPAYSVGGQFGVLYKPIPALSLGLIYITPQPTVFRHVADFDGNGTLDKLTLESPNIVGVGIGYSLYDDRLLFSVDGKWLNWSNADGYSDFDWKDQWVVAVGVQYAAIPKKLFLRLGYNFGNNPVSAHSGWNGSLATPAPDFVNVQGKMVPRYYYETFRTIGFPAVVENHITCGVGYAFSEKFELNIAYMHAFGHDVTEHGINIAGQPTRIKSTLSEDSVDLGLTWRF